MSKDRSNVRARRAGLLVIAAIAVVAAIGGSGSATAQSAPMTVSIDGGAYVATGVGAALSVGTLEGGFDDSDIERYRRGVGDAQPSRFALALDSGDTTRLYRYVTSRTNLRDLAFVSGDTTIVLGSPVLDRLDVTIGNTKDHEVLFGFETMTVSDGGESWCWNFSTRRSC